MAGPSGANEFWPGEDGLDLEHCVIQLLHDTQLHQREPDLRVIANDHAEGKRADTA
jgi:hypothetical protein